MGHCKCANEVTCTWKKDVDATKLYDMTKNLCLLCMWKERGYVCYAHTKMMGSHMGLQVRHLNEQGLKSRLDYLYQHHDNIRQVKAVKGTYH